MKIIFNDLIINDTENSISLLSSGFNYGEGFFTTIKVVNSDIKNLELHKNRLLDSLNYFHFTNDNMKFIIKNLEIKIKEVLILNNLVNARVKISIFKDTKDISYIIFCNNLILKDEEHELHLANFFRGDDPLYKFKSLNYLTNLNNKNSIYRDHKNRILETGFANIFMIKDNRIYTPPKSLPILPGTYREYLLSIKSINGYDILEKELFVDDIKNCDGFFITNSIIEIAIVSKIDNIKIPTIISRNIKVDLNI